MNVHAMEDGREGRTLAERVEDALAALEGEQVRLDSDEFDRREEWRGSGSLVIEHDGPEPVGTSGIDCLEGWRDVLDYSDGWCTERVREAVEVRWTVAKIELGFWTVDWEVA